MNKYRPSFTLQEIQVLLLGLDALGNNLPAQQTKTKLKLLLAKVDLGALGPAYETAPSKPSMLTRLGETGEEVELSMTQKRESAYIKYKGMPQSCTTREIDMAQTYMYENNMMTQDEREAYETKYFGD